MALTKETKAEIAKQYALHGTDTGSAALQVAMLSRRISDLTEHLKANKKDFACQRGLMILVGQRRRLLNYLKKNRTPDAYRELITGLGLRK